MKKSQTYVNKPVYLGLLIIELIKVLKFDFCCDYVNLKDCIKKHMIFIKTSQQMFKFDFILKIMN